MTDLPPPATLARLLRARDRLHDAPADSPTIAALAADVRLSRAHFLRSFVRAFGVTPHDCLMAIRMDVAKRALARGASVTETCLDAGFSSLGSRRRSSSRPRAIRGDPSGSDPTRRPRSL
jgi:AraC-like DNA-binding protein